MSQSGRPTSAASVDWAALRRRIDDLGREIAGEVRHGPEQVAALLAERARRLAMPLARERDTEEVLEVVVFALAGETYAVETRFVLEVLRGCETAVLPGVEPPIVGITAWRGELLPLLDLRAVLGLPPAAGGAATEVVVLGDRRRAFGVSVQAARELREIPAAAVRPLQGADPAAGRFLRGSTTEAVLVLAAEELLHTYG